MPVFRSLLDSTMTSLRLAVQIGERCHSIVQVRLVTRAPGLLQTSGPVSMTSGGYADWLSRPHPEPVCEHLQALPNLPRVTKVQAAMDEESGEETLHCVSAENIQRYMGRYHAELPDYPSSPVDVMWYAKSLSCIGRPHPDLTPMLAKIGRCDLLEKRIVRVLSWAELCDLHGVGSVDTVQLDCEGRDCAILRGVLSHCDKDPTALPRVIQFEANHLTDDLEIAETVDALKAHGYKVRAQNGRNILVDR